MVILKKMVVLLLSLAVIITMSMGFGLISEVHAADTTTSNNNTTTVSNVSATSSVAASRAKFKTIKVKWDAVDDADGYVVTATKKGKSTKISQVVTDTDADYSNLSNNSQYKFSVKAYVSADGTEKYSSAKSTDYIVSGYLKTTAKTSKSVSLKWSAIADTTNYSVVVMNKNGKTLKTKAAKTNKTKVTGLKADTKYKFKVVATKSTSETTTSTTVTTTTNSDYIWPSASRQILSGYGYRSGYGSSYHEGIDIGTGYGAKAKAIKSGTVILAKYYFGYGKCVEVSHGNGVVSLYAHLSSIKVHKGQRVSQGQMVGRTGATGSATCAHLHFSMMVHGNMVNPLNYLP